MQDLSGLNFTLLLSETDSSVYRCTTEAMLLIDRSNGSISDSFQRERLIAQALQGSSSCAFPTSTGMWVSGREVMVFEDPGGDPLEPETGSSDILEFLRRAIRIALAVAEIHERGVIHGEIRPGRILMLPTKAVLFGFSGGMVQGFPHTQGPTLQTNVDALPYRAPNETQLAPSFDPRGDLYSLGITLYEHLSGKLPFNASTALGWKHAHNAREPAPVGRWLPSVPASVAAVIMKSISKRPEERYQSALGLVADLKKCLEQAVENAADVFVLGARDTRDHLVLSQRVYGRHKEISRLKQYLAEVHDTRQSKVVLLSGYSGIGKTRLVEAFRQEIAAEGCLFSSGKFDQVSHSSPYATLTYAMGGLVRQILTLPDAAISQRRKSLQEALGENGALITALNPDLGALLGPQPELPLLPPAESQIRFQQTLGRALQAFAEAELPLVLFLDDLQWADVATLDLLRRIDRKDSVRNILLIGAYRDNEVDPSGPLPELIKKSLSIPLGPLSLDDTIKLVADSLGASPQVVEPVARAIADRTAGNPLFIEQLLSAAIDESIVSFDGTARSWSWDLDQLSLANVGDIVSLVTQRLRRLSDETRHSLSRFACIGNRSTISTLSVALDLEPTELHRAFEDALAAGLIYRLDDGYAFLHDRVQEGAYALIEAEEVPNIHLELARRLASFELDSGDEHIFDIVEQYNRGKDLVDASREIEFLAEMNHRAGLKAERAAAYANALRYYSVAIDLFDPSGETAFDCQIRSADCEFLTNSADAAESRLLSLRGRVISTYERGRIAWSRITIKTAQGDLAGAIAICIEYVAEQGIHWSAHPEESTVLEEFHALSNEIEDDRIQDRLDLPRLTNRDNQAVLDVLGATLPPAFFSDRNLVCLILCKMANLSKDFGNCASSALGYAYLGMVLGPIFGNYQAGFEYGRVALKLVQQAGFERFKGRVSMTFAYHVHPYSKPIRDGRKLLQDALLLSKESGDLTYTGFSSCTMVSSMLASGEPLSVTARRAEQALSLADEIGFGLISDIVATQLQMTRCLQGLTLSPHSLSDGHFDEVAFESRLASSPSLAIANCWHHIRKCEAHVHLGDFAVALESARIAEPLLWSTEGHLELVEYHFYIAIAKARTGAVAGEITPHAKHLDVLSKSCPENFASMSFLISAEISRREGNLLEALKLYDLAVAAAATSEFPHIEGLASEFCAQALAEAGMATLSSETLKRSRDRYKTWGAAAKVSMLDHQHPELRPLVTLPDATAFLNADVETVVRSSAALAGEAVPSQMIRTLMTITLEQAGAQRALLVLPRGEDYLVEAEATATGESIDVTFQREKVKRSDRLEPLLKAGLMTLEPVIEIERPSGSAMLLPLVARGKAIGAIYMENDLNKEAFSPVRTSMLKLIAAQAAISLENASLDEKESLLKEVHHRVKNNLQLISSLLNLQASKIDDPRTAELFAESRNRVRSMALVHENLYRAGNFSSVPMATHIKNLSTQLARAYGAAERRISLSVDAAQVDLDLDQAISCGLILNELVSNALKHAFPDEPTTDGQVRISFLRTEGSRVVLRVHDNGRGLPPKSERVDSLGMQLVADLSDQLNGNLEIATENGTQVSVTFEAHIMRDQE